FPTVYSGAWGAWVVVRLTFSFGNRRVRKERGVADTLVPVTKLRSRQRQPARQLDSGWAVKPAISRLARLRLLFLPRRIEKRESPAAAASWSEHLGVDPRHESARGAAERSEQRS